MTNITICFLTAFSLFISFTLKAQSYDPQHLFIKMKNKGPLKSSPYIQSTQELIAGLYLVKTNNIIALEAEVSTWDIEYTQKDRIHYHQPLPKAKDYNYSPSLEWSRTPAILK